MSLIERVRSHISDPQPSANEFEELALEAFAFQYDRIPAYRALCDRSRRHPGTVASWREVPLVPAAAFATVALSTAPAIETFRSSGTLGGERSVHGQPYPDLYRAVVDATFPSACLPRDDRPPMLALVPPRAVAPDSSLGFMIDHVLTRFGGDRSSYGFGARGVELGTCRSWLGAAQRSGRPVMVLATALALADLLERIARLQLHFRLPAGSAVLETGGYKGRSRQVSRSELFSSIERWLGVPRTQVVSEYGMTELTSHAYSRTLLGGDPQRLFPPPWLKARALDPVTLTALPPDAEGLLAFFDLANLGSALHVLTEDLGAVDTDGAIRLAGRAGDAELRGCSLLAEELARP